MLKCVNMCIASISPTHIHIHIDPSTNCEFMNMSSTYVYATQSTCMLPFFRINNTSKMLDEMPVMSNEHHACTCIFWYEHIIKLGTKNVAPWNGVQYKSDCEHETNFNNTLNRTMENLISKYMSDTAIGGNRASATYDDTIECRDAVREREIGRECTISESLLWCDSRYVLFGNIPFSCLMQSRTRIHNGSANEWEHCTKHSHIDRCGLGSWIER